MKLGKIIRNSWDLLILIICGGVAIVLDQLNLIPDSYISALILLVICAFAIHEILEKEKRKEEHEELLKVQNECLQEVKKLIVKGIEARVFNNRPEFYNFIIQRFKDLSCTLDITNFTPQPASTTGIPERSQYFQAVTDLIRNNNQIEVRRIVSITTKEKFNWVENKEIQGLKDCNNFHLGYYEFPKKHIPSYTIILLDKKEIFLGIYWEPAHRGHRDQNIWIKNDEICKAFGDYFDVLWDNSIKLKEGVFIFTDELYKLRREFEDNKI